MKVTCRLKEILKMTVFRQKGADYLIKDPINNIVQANYDDAIKALNGLQSNLAQLKEAAENINDLNRPHKKRMLTIKYLKRCGIDIDDFENEVSVIHVTGTKGKGSTCFLCESIIRAHGYKTGLFTSPHIMNVRERIRINGVSLSSSEFTDHFWPIYNLLDNNKDNEQDMPSYFKFLTVMAFSVFIKEKVDVAIFEVGIGGEFDCTNVFKKTPVVGITSLGLDHTSILGNTIESIAWQKSGIIKENSLTFTVDDHEKSALKVIEERAKEKNSELFLVPNIGHFNWNLERFGPIQRMNAPLAVHIAQAWINLKNHTKFKISEIDKTTESAIESCNIPGRCQIIPRGPHIYHLDGAHTVESVQFCLDWFHSTLRKDQNKILVFNLTKGRSAEVLLTPFIKFNFSKVIFSPNNINTSHETSPRDLFDLCASTQDNQSRLKSYKDLWVKMTGCDPEKVFVSSSISETISTIESSPEPAQILVTGSLHLVGSVLTYFLPEN